MNCGEFDAGLAAYTAGELAGIAAEDMLRHAEGCANCRLLLVRYEGLQRELEGLPRAQCPPELLERVLEAAIERPAAGSADGEKTRPRRFAAGFFAFAAAAALAAVLLIRGGFHAPGGAEPYTDEEIRAARLQVELALGYLNRYGVMTGNVLQEDVILKSIRRPVEASLKKTIGHF